MQCPDRTTNLTRGLFSSPPEGFFRTTSPAGGFRFIQKRTVESKAFDRSYVFQARTCLKNGLNY
jgi:hypothetical protein